VSLTDVRFGPHYGLKSDIAPSPKSASKRLMHRSKQLKLFDFVGAGEQKMPDCDLAEMARVKT